MSIESPLIGNILKQVSLPKQRQVPHIPGQNEAHTINIQAEILN